MTFPKIDISSTVDFTDMFKNCTSLTGFSDLGYTFMIDDKVYKFTKNELERLQSSCSNFKFESKDIPRMRKITNHYMKTFHPEDLL